MSCNKSRLKQLMVLDEATSEYRMLADHVDSCPRCQRRLQEMSSDRDFIDQVRDTLQNCGETDSYHGMIGSSVAISVESASDDDGFAEFEPLSLDFLAAPSHPEMLGRIGRYEVERVIGSGGMGIVLKGFDTELHRVVAIKVLKPHLAHIGAARHRFAREAQSAAAVVHEHVIPIYDVQSDGEMPFLVMQYVPGQSLQARVDERGPLDAREVLRIAVQAASGLAAAHAQGLVHRDVKPANILLEESVERVLISDFGLARTVDDATLTRTGIVAGTPHYMSPEQASGNSVDHRSDLFSLGSVIYFMCTGRPPFRAEHALAVLNRICQDTHRPVDEVNSQIPAELAEVVDQLLSKRPGDRFRTAAEVVQRLESILSRLQQGQRSTKLRWRRSWLRWRGVLQKTLLATIAVMTCVMCGMWVAWSWSAISPYDVNGQAHRQTTPVSPPDLVENRGTRVDVVVRRQSSHSGPPSLIEDFQKELSDVQSMVDDIHNRWGQPTIDHEFDSWKAGLSEILGQIKALELTLPPLISPVPPVPVGLPPQRLEE